MTIVDTVVFSAVAKDLLDGVIVCCQRDVDVGEAWYQNVLHFLPAAISACPLLAYMQYFHSKMCLYVHVCVCMCVDMCEDTWGGQKKDSL